MSLHPGEAFRVGEVWVSPKGSLYKVVGTTTPTQVVLRKGADGTGRKSFRRWDCVDGWTLYTPNA